MQRLIPLSTVVLIAALNEEQGISPTLTERARTGLRIVRWVILKGWKPKSAGFDIETEMNHLVERAGYQTIEIPVQYRARIGEKKLKLRHGLIILKRIISESIRSSSNYSKSKHAL